MQNQNIERVIQEKFRPILRGHGGDIEYVGITADGLVRVKLTGACAGCPGAQQTLTDIVATELQAACPEVTGVVPVTAVSDDLINQALKIIRKNQPCQ